MARSAVNRTGRAWLVVSTMPMKVRGAVPGAVLAMLFAVCATGVGGAQEATGRAETLQHGPDPDRDSARAAGRLIGAVDLSYYLPAEMRYDPRLPTPLEFFGFEVGQRHLYHHEIVGYMNALAAASDRVSIEEYARTDGHRPLILLTITSPRNHERLEDIRQRHVSLSDPAESAEIEIGREPVVLFMGYGVHGNESSAANAAPLVAYHLAASRDQSVADLLNHAVILIDPCLNPDGHDRFAHHANSFRGHSINADPSHREHIQRWPSGRTNYYFFDLNRDWMPAVHPESQGRLRIFHRWKPNIVNDYHEMGTNSTYFFQPGIPERTNPLIPQENIDLTRRIAEYHAQALDEHGVVYFTEERFDDFYIGKGSTYPDLHGSIGILYEQASARGHAQESIHGLITFPQTIRNQVLTSRSTFRAAMDLREDLLNHQREFHREALRDGERAGFAGYLFTAPHDAPRLQRFLDFLRLHDVRVARLEEEAVINGRRYPAGASFIVPAEQPEYRFVQSLFETRTEFIAEVFYDVSAWTMPLAFGLQFDRFGRAEVAQALEPIDDPRVDREMPSVDRSEIGYLIDWRSSNAPRIVYELLDEGIGAYVATREFEASTTEGRMPMGYGTVLVRVGPQREDADRIHAILAAAASVDVHVHAAAAGLSPLGIDLGSDSFAPLERPRVLVASGDGTRENSVGEIWHFLDKRLGIPTTLVDCDRIASVDLNEYTVVVLPEGSLSGISSRAQSNLSEWVQRGGTLIALGSAVRWCRRAGLTEIEAVQRDSTRPDEAERRPFIESIDARAVHRISGAIFEAAIDPTHPVGYGYGTESPATANLRLAVFLTQNEAMALPSNPFATPAAFTDEPLLSGYASAENLQALGGAGAVVVEQRGRGRVILFAINPLFRGHWAGTERLFVNSVFFGSAVRVPADGYAVPNGQTEQQGGFDE